MKKALLALLNLSLLLAAAGGVVLTSLGSAPLLTRAAQLLPLAGTTLIFCLSTLAFVTGTKRACIRAIVANAALLAACLLMGVGVVLTSGSGAAPFVITACLISGMAVLNIKALMGHST